MPNTSRQDGGHSWTLILHKEELVPCSQWLGEEIRQFELNEQIYKIGEMIIVHIFWIFCINII